jgi:hypothetical protein
MRHGYGVFALRKKHLVRAHRWSWEIANKQRVPEGRWVLHRCDNPPCVRPDHLFLGDPKANIADMLAKGRGLTGRKFPGKGLKGDLNPSHLHPETRARGERHGSRTHPEKFLGQSSPGEANGNARLTEMAVRELRHLFAEGADREELASRYAITRSHVNRIVSGRSWGHLR